MFVYSGRVPSNMTKARGGVACLSSTCSPILTMAKTEGLTHLREEIVGILKYANKAPSFSGILKQR